MARALSEDLRARAVAAYRAGASCREVSERFGIAPSSVVKWAKRGAGDGEPRARQTGRPPAGKAGAAPGLYPDLH